MSLRHKLKKTLWMLGYDLSKFDPKSNALARRKKLFESFSIDVVIDVGASTGEFAKEMRKDLGFSGKIISFEPLSSAFKLLKQSAAADSKWEAINCALGQTNSKMEINIAGNSDSSSLLKMLPSHIQAAPESNYIGKEIVEIKKLDSIIDKLCSKSNKVYLKIDTQGYENSVIQGAKESLENINTIQIEMSLTPLYEGELSFVNMHNLLTEKGYNIVSIESGFTDSKTGQLLQIDGIYHRF